MAWLRLCSNVCLSVSVCQMTFACCMQKAYKTSHKNSLHIVSGKEYVQKYGADLVQIIANWLSITLPDTIQKRRDSHVEVQQQQSWNGLFRIKLSLICDVYCTHPVTSARIKQTNKQDKTNTPKLNFAHIIHPKTK